MQAPSSPSLPPRNPTNPQMRLGIGARSPLAPSRSERHLRTPRRVTFCKRRGTLLNKVSELCGLTGARAAVIVLSSTGRLYFSGGSSVEEMEETSFDYVRRNGGAMPPMGPKEGWEWVKKRRQRTEIARIADPVQLRRSFSNRLMTLIKMTSELCTVTDARAAVVVFSHTGIHCQFGNSSFENIIFDWVKKQCDSCKTKEEFDSLKLNYAAVLDCVRKRLKELENNPSVKASASGDYGVGVDCDFELLNDDEIDSLLQSFKASHPLLFALFKDYVRHGECGSFLTLPVKSAAGCGSSGVKSTPVCSVPEGCAYNAASGGNSGVESIPTCSDLEGCGFDPEDFLNLSEDCIGDGDCGSFLTLPENSADRSGSSGEEPMRSDLEGCGYNPDDFAALEDLDVSLAI